jgi:hypothetical protein
MKNPLLAFGVLLIFTGFLFLIMWSNPSLIPYVGPVAGESLFLMLGISCELLGIPATFFSLKRRK